MQQLLDPAGRTETSEKIVELINIVALHWPVDDPDWCMGKAGDGMNV
jgi:hypothetical protein